MSAGAFISTVFAGALCAWTLYLSAREPSAFYGVLYLCTSLVMALVVVAIAIGVVR